MLDKVCDRVERAISKVFSLTIINHNFVEYLYGLVDSFIQARWPLI